MRLILNKDSGYCEKVMGSIRNKDGYCPCQVGCSVDSICPFRNKKDDELDPVVLLKDICKNGQKDIKCYCDLYEV